MHLAVQNNVDDQLHSVQLLTVVSLFSNNDGCMYMFWNLYLPGGFLAGSLWLGLPGCPESIKK